MLLIDRLMGKIGCDSLNIIKNKKTSGEKST